MSYPPRSIGDEWAYFPHGRLLPDRMRVSDLLYPPIYTWEFEEAHPPSLKKAKKPKKKEENEEVLLLTHEPSCEVKVTWEQLCAEHDLMFRSPVVTNDYPNDRSSTWIHLPMPDNYYMNYVAPVDPYAWLGYLVYTPTQSSHCWTWTTDDKSLRLDVDEDEDKA